MKVQSLFLCVCLSLTLLGSASAALDDIDGGNGANFEKLMADYSDARSYVIFDEVCTLLGTCYQNNDQGYEQCVRYCPEGECYECKGMTSISYCCLNF
jgi:hypothetical protein